MSYQYKIRKFWQKRTLCNFLLLPLSFIYYIISDVVNKLTSPKSVNAKVICVGGAIVGGSGKTPVAIALAKHLLSKNKKVAFISRGYLGTLSSRSIVTKVDETKHSYLEVGDEAILLGRVAPTYICINRYEAAKQAIKDGAGVIIMDDGLQNNSLKRDLSILVVDDYLFGNGFLIPAGPLRETVNKVLAKVDLIVNMGSKLFLTDKPQVKGHIKLIRPKKLKEGYNYIAMCGIGNPEKFLSSLSSLNINLMKTFIFSDHYVLEAEELSGIIKFAKENNTLVITTTKDFIKIPVDLQQYFILLEMEATLEIDSL